MGQVSFESMLDVFQRLFLQKGLEKLPQERALFFFVRLWSASNKNFHIIQSTEWIHYTCCAVPEKSSQSSPLKASGIPLTTKSRVFFVRNILTPWPRSKKRIFQDCSFIFSFNYKNQKKKTIMYTGSFFHVSKKNPTKLHFSHSYIHIHCKWQHQYQYC